MAILAGTARWLGRNRPARGRAVVLFQPAEEDGSGAARVIADAGFARLVPDYALALHNYPGLPLGHAVLAPGPMNCASRGMKIVLSGRTAHASQPERGQSPAPALARLIAQLTALGQGDRSADPMFAMATVTHAALGEPAFGIAPGRAELWVTLRTQADRTMADLCDRAETAVHAAANADGLAAAITWHDIFHQCENHPEATQLLMQALAAESIPVTEGNLPMRASEDFGRFGAVAKSAMFLLGAGTDSPGLHNPDYDFPDTLIPVGARVFVRALQTRLF
jgi:amidohydrolase